MEEVDASLVGLVDRVTRRMRTAHRVGRTVTLRLRFDDSTRATRSHTMPRATAHTGTVLFAARELLAVARPLIDAQGITLVGISVGNLDDDRAVQLTLPFRRGSGGALDAALDDLRERFGSGSVTRVVLLGRDPGLTVPLLPD
jgi:DNA polymerase-4